MCAAFQPAAERKVNKLEFKSNFHLKNGENQVQIPVPALRFHATSCRNLGSKGTLWTPHNLAYSCLGSDGTYGGKVLRHPTCARRAQISILFSTAITVKGLKHKTNTRFAPPLRGQGGALSLSYAHTHTHAHTHTQIRDNAGQVRQPDDLNLTHFRMAQGQMGRVQIGGGLAGWSTSLIRKRPPPRTPIRP